MAIPRGFISQVRAVFAGPDSSGQAIPFVFTLLWIQVRNSPFRITLIRKTWGGGASPILLSWYRSLRRHTPRLSNAPLGPAFDSRLSTVDCSREFRTSNSETGLCLSTMNYRPSTPLESMVSQAQLCNPIRMNTYTNAALKTLWNEHLQKKEGSGHFSTGRPNFEFRASSFGAVNCRLSFPCPPSHTSSTGNFLLCKVFDTMWRLWPGRTSN